LNARILRSVVSGVKESVPISRIATASRTAASGSEVPLNDEFSNRKNQEVAALGVPGAQDAGKFQSAIACEMAISRHLRLALPPGGVIFFQSSVR
jgi:hypothetical protein